MKYNEKLGLYFKKKGISQSEAGERLGHSKSMMSRFLSGVSIFDATFIVALVKEFPDIDLKYIFSEEELKVEMVEEPCEPYGMKEENIIPELELIEEKLANIKKCLAQNRHKK